jgi:chorismate mutase
MKNDKLNSALAHIREEIDAIDAELIALLKARCAFVEQV